MMTKTYKQSIDQAGEFTFIIIEQKPTEGASWEIEKQ
jgi:hypothetical protein